MRVDLEQVNLNVVQEIVLIKIAGQFINVLVDIAKENKRLRIRQT